MVKADVVFTVVLILGVAILVLQQAGWGPCRKCRKAHREPRCAYCDSGQISGGGDGDIRRPKFTDPLSRKRRGEDD
jgi:hypothetical protein